MPVRSSYPSHLRLHIPNTSTIAYSHSSVLCFSALLTWIHHIRIFVIDPHVSSIQLCYVCLASYRCGTGCVTASAVYVLPSTLSSRFRDLYTSLCHSYFHQTSSHNRTRYFSSLRTRFRHFFHTNVALCLSLHYTKCGPPSHMTYIETTRRTTCLDTAPPPLPLIFVFIFPE